MKAIPDFFGKRKNKIYSQLLSVKISLIWNKR